MKRYLPNLKSIKGFTLIELLVVIGILGVLAAALVATIDPFEQIKKAADSNTKNVSVEFSNAVLRYYTTHNAFPWAALANGGSDCNGGSAPTGSVTLTDATLATCVTALTTENELKAAFSQDVNDLKAIYVTYDANLNDVITCFQPQSKSQQTVANHNADGTVNNNTHTCTFNNGVPANLNGGCFWCTSNHS